jgi:hypothetical protein
MSSIQMMNECPICFDDIDTNKNCVITECGHKFHASCLLRSVAFGNFDCPCCRFELAEGPEEESDDGFDEEDDDDYEINDETMQSMRWLFQRAEGEELEEEELDDDEEEDQVPEVPLNYVVDNLQTMNYTFEDMIKIILNDFLDNEQDERSASILETVDSLIGRYEEDMPVAESAVATAIASVATSTSNSSANIDVAEEEKYEDDYSEHDYSEDEEDKEMAEYINSFVPKINFNIVRRYQTTSDLCGNN